LKIFKQINIVSEDPAKLQKMTAAMSEAKAALMGHLKQPSNDWARSRKLIMKPMRIWRIVKTLSSMLLNKATRFADLIEIIKKQWETRKLTAKVNDNERKKHML